MIQNLHPSRTAIGCAVLTLVFAAAAAAQSHLAADDKIIADENQPADWLAFGRTHNERRFSPLNQITDTNVARLGVAWHLDLPNDVGLVSTPLVIDGVLYFTGGLNLVRAVDARTGKLIWEFDPKVAAEIAGRRQEGMAHNRGISFSRGKIFSTTWDGRLIALEARTGYVGTDFLGHGIVNPKANEPDVQPTSNEERRPTLQAGAPGGGAERCARRSRRGLRPGKFPAALARETQSRSGAAPAAWRITRCAQPTDGRARTAT